MDTLLVILHLLVKILASFDRTGQNYLPDYPGVNTNTYNIIIGLLRANG